MKRMALPHINFHLYYPLRHIRNNSPLALSSIENYSLPIAFSASERQRFSSTRTSVHSGCSWYCSLIYLSSAASMYAKMVQASWSEQSANQSISCIPLSHLSCLPRNVYLSCLPRNVYLSDLWFCKVRGMSKFSLIQSLSSEVVVRLEGVASLRQLSSLLLNIILSLYTPSLKITFCTSSLRSLNYTSPTLFTSKRKYFYSASIPRSFLQPEVILPYQSILKSKRSTHYMRLNWSFRSILLSRVSHWSEMGLMSLGMRRSLSLITLISCEMELDSKGQQPNSISKRTTPRDQMSALRVYISSLRIQGAMYMGEPSMVCAMFISSILQKPKSPNLTLPSEKKMLSGLRSLCMMLFLLSSLKASSSCLKIMRASSSLRLFFLWRRDSSVPPLQYSQTKQKLLGVLRVQTKRTMLSFLRVERMLISLMASCSNLGLALKELFGITFTAYSNFDFWCSALKTWPQTPFPIGYCNRQFSTSLLIQIYNDSQTGPRTNRPRTRLPPPPRHRLQGKGRPSVEGRVRAEVRDLHDGPSADRGAAVAGAEVEGGTQCFEPRGPRGARPRVLPARRFRGEPATEAQEIQDQQERQQVLEEKLAPQTASQTHILLIIALFFPIIA